MVRWEEDDESLVAYDDSGSLLVEVAAYFEGQDERFALEVGMGDATRFALDDDVAGLVATLAAVPGVIEVAHVDTEVLLVGGTVDPRALGEAALAWWLGVPPA